MKKNNNKDKSFAQHIEAKYLSKYLPSARTSRHLHLTVVIRIGTK